MATSSRVASLDGLRGVAALVVLAHHALLTMSGFAAVYWNLPHPGFVSPWAYTPLHVVWAGSEAVLVFFVLSGVVLMLPAARGRPQLWRAYYPSRLVRLYVPVAFAVVFALALARIWPRTTTPDDSPWIQMHQEAPTIAAGLQNLFLLGGTTWLDSPLWSLRWEVVFSLLLPLYLWVSLRWGGRWWAPIGVVLVALTVAGGYFGIDALRYLPYFGLGTLVAVKHEELTAIADRFGTTWRSTVLQLAFLIAAILALTFTWWPAPLLPAALGPLSQVIVPLGATAVVVAVICLPIVRRAMSSRVLLAAGTISFSLYLVHEPILVTLAVVMPPDMSWAPPLIGVPLALLAGWLFYLLVERNTHRLARRVARLLTPRKVHADA